MTYLLDSNTVLWIVLDSQKLGSATRNLVAAASPDTIKISIASLWELYIKASIGKLQLDQDLEIVLVNKGIEITPILPQYAKKLVELPKIHRDPFDRLLIAQAMSEDLTLITGDQDILKYPTVKLLDAGQ